MISSKPMVNAYSVVKTVLRKDEPTMLGLLCFSIESSKIDRYGMKLEINLPDGSIVSGRYSRNHRFNGTRTYKTGEVKRFRHASAYL